MDFICCDDFKEDVVNIILLGYREKIRKSAMREKKYCTFNISSFTCCKGIFFLSTAESDQAFTKIGSKRWVSLSEKPLINSASFTFRSLWFVVLKSWKELQSCRQIIFPKPSHALQLWKQDVYDTSLSFLRCQKPLLLDMLAPLLWRGQCMKLMFRGPCSNTTSIPITLALGGKRRWTATICWLTWSFHPKFIN